MHLQLDNRVKTRDISKPWVKVGKIKGLSTTLDLNESNTTHTHRAPVLRQPRQSLEPATFNMS